MIMMLFNNINFDGYLRYLNKRQSRSKGELKRDQERKAERRREKKVNIIREVGKRVKYQTNFNIILKKQQTTILE